MCWNFTHRDADLYRVEVPSACRYTCIPKQDPASEVLLSEYVFSDAIFGRTELQEVLRYIIWLPFPVNSLFSGYT